MAYLNIPELTSTQKQQMKNLMDGYFDAAADQVFAYRSDTRRESYASTKKIASTADAMGGCMNTAGKYLMNYGVFAQMIWMGRKIEDFTSHLSTPTTSISKAFDWGYYFDFVGAKNAYGVKKADGTYYTSNTYKEGTATKFITFDGSSALADELHRKGYEIPYGQADIGDMVFYRTESINDGDSDEEEATNFRNITLAGIVYDVNSDGTLTVMECSTVYSNKIGKCGLSPASGLSTFSILRGSNLNFRVAMCARHPAAYGDGGNVPVKFETYRHK